jgi:hypothetical protein
VSESVKINSNDPMYQEISNNEKIQDAAIRKKSNWTKEQ